MQALQKRARTKVLLYVLKVLYFTLERKNSQDIVKYKYQKYLTLPKYLRYFTLYHIESFLLSTR